MSYKIFELSVDGACLDPSLSVSRVHGNTVLNADQRANEHEPLFKAKNRNKSALRRLKHEINSQKNVAQLVGESKKGADSVTFDNQNTELMNTQHLIANGSNSELVDILMKYANNSRGYTVLEEAVYQKDYRAIDVLLENGYSINNLRNEKTPAVIAVLCDDEQMLDYLLERGAKLSRENIGHIARFGLDGMAKPDQALKRLELLINKGISLKITPAILRKIFPNISIEALKLFLAAETDISGEPYNNGKATFGIIFYAVKRGDLDIIKLLIDNGASLNGGIMGPYNPPEPMHVYASFNPLSVAILKGQIDIAILLLEHGAISPLFVGDGRKPSIDLLKYAFDHKYYDLITLMCKNGSSGGRNYGVSGKYTYLQQAIVNEDVKMVLAFLEGGVNPNQKGGRGKCNATPLKVALEKGNREIVDLLLQYGAQLEDV